MKFGKRQRGVVLAGLLMATLSAAAWVREGDKTGDVDVVEAPARKNATSKRMPAEHREPEVERVHLEKLQPRPSPDRSDDVFAARSWRKPAPKATAADIAAAAPVPTAPPLPFAYLGRLSSDDTRQVFVSQGERNLILHEGETVDAIYRVEKLSDAGVTFIHLPTGIRQDMPIPSGESQ
jgi:hypothetical protein